MKRIGFLFDEICSYDNLLKAYCQASKGKHCKPEVVEFSKRFDENISLLKSGLESGRVTIGNYHYFEIYDPKQRKICAASFPERIMHHAIINVCQPIFEKTLISNTFATRKGKGIYQAIDKAMSLMRHNDYVAKLDYHKYYDSIDHVVLKMKLRRLFKDSRLLNLLDAIIDSYQVADHKGLPIGNLTSQYFANIYLSVIDHASTEQFNAGGYVRYMDDMLVFNTSRIALLEAVRRIKIMSESQHLKLKSPIIVKTGNGVNFLGYKIYPHHFVMSGRSKRRFRKKLRQYGEKFISGLWTEKELSNHITPLTAFATHGSNYKFRMSSL